MYKLSGQNVQRTYENCLSVSQKVSGVRPECFLQIKENTSGVELFAHIQ